MLSVQIQQIGRRSMMDPYCNSKMFVTNHKHYPQAPTFERRSCDEIRTIQPCTQHNTAHNEAYSLNDFREAVNCVLYLFMCGTNTVY